MTINGELIITRGVIAPRKPIAPMPGSGWRT